MPEAAGDGSTHTVSSLPTADCHMAVSSMSRSDDHHLEADRRSTLLVFLSGRLCQLAITTMSSQSFDAFEDVFVDVCPHLVCVSIAIQETLLRHWTSGQNLMQQVPRCTS